ncbi:Scr1 family TA system antitoxin-like transcriptional regulator [Kitasatospora sp. NPDC050543]|uniref:helix-turn-helix domain-containing protein n=1 Tax=Kitasatospora sp. NPDC050543 TaxID=3364054 RepID=UPI0037BAC6DD
MGRRKSGKGGSTASSAELFGSELRHERELVGLSQAQLAKQLHCDRTLVTHVENGSRVPQDDFVRRCDEVLNAAGRLFRMWEKVDWYAEVEHPDWFKRFAAMESRAVALRKFQVQMIPGLLQTENYARALFGRRVSESTDIEELVAARLSRQSRFLAADGPLLVVVLDESAIRRPVGGLSVMREQLAYLLEVAERSNVILQVAPFDLDAPTMPDTSLTLVTLPDGEQWIYSESLERGHFNNDPSVIAQHARAYDVLRADVLSVRESAALITGEMERCNAYDEPRRSQRGGLAQEQLQRQQRRRLHRGGPRVPRPRPGA